MSKSPANDEGKIPNLYHIIGIKEERISNLEGENVLLRKQLNDAWIKQGGPEQPGLCTNVDHSILEADLAALKQQNDDLLKRYDDLQAKQTEFNERIRKADRKYEAAKNSAKQWKAYIDSKLEQQAKSRSDGALINPMTPEVTPAVLPTSGYGVTPRTAVRRHSPVKDGDDLALPSAPVNETSAVRPRATPRIPSDTDTSTAAPRSSPPTSTQQGGRVTSSQTTEADQSSVPEATAEDNQLASSDGGIEIVSERALKRKRSDSRTAMPPPTRVKQEPRSPQRAGSEDRPLEIKSEDYSSPTTERNPVLRMETSDLDAMTGALRTPRRRRLAEAVGARAMSEEVTRSNFRPPRMIARDSSSLSDGDIADMDDRLKVLREGVNAEGPHAETQTKVLSVNSRNVQRRDLQQGQRSALRHISPNVPTPPRAAKDSDKAERARKAGIFAEDGDEDSSQVTPKQNAPVPLNANTPASNRLEAMLEQSTQPNSRESLPKRKTPEARPRQTRKPQAQTQQKPTSKVAPSGSPPQTTRSRFRLPNLEKSPPPVRPEEEPLRLKPVTALYLSDFRINPAYSETSYAHATSIRDKATKACLPGCTNPICCGTWITSARLGTLPPLSKPRDEILHDYLGPGWRGLMASFAESKRRETWIQAQAQQAANQFGKHKVQFERARSPPGFWRTEMPTTQEEIEDRREAEERTREKVEERWREALRENGKWVFRDEMPAAGGRRT